MGRLGQQPGERQLRHGAIILARDSRKAVEQLEILLEMLALEARHGEADVLGRKRGCVAQIAGEKPTRQRAESDERCANLSASVQGRYLGIARPQGIFRLNRTDRVNAMGLAKRIGGDLGEPDGLDLSLFHHLGHRPDAVLDRNALVPAMKVIKVDRIGLQAFEAVLTGLCEDLGPAIDFAQPLCVAEHAAFAGEHILPATCFQDIADQRLIGAKAVKRRRIDKAVAEIERFQQHRARGLRIGRRPISVGKAHAAHAEGGDFERTELARLHGRRTTPPLGAWDR